MKSRTVLHLVALVTLIGIGVWIGYRGVVAPTHLGPVAIDLDLAAMYWFALMIYGFVGLVLYYPLRKRSWWVLAIGHGCAAAIALTSTAALVALGHQRAPARVDAPAESTQAAKDLPNFGHPSGQPLPLPPSKHPFPAQIEQP
jgi:hypothetical protein